MTKIWHWVFLFLLFLSLWYLRYQTGKFPLQPSQRVEISATVRTEPSIKRDYQLVWLIIGSEIIGIKAPLFPQIHYGDTFTAAGKLKRLTSGSLLSQRRWLLSTDTLSLNQDPPPLPLSLLINIRQKILQDFFANLPLDEASLLAGITLGTQSNLSKEFQKALIITGTLHVVVASGMNVALVAGTTAHFFTKFLRRQWALVLGLLTLWIYVFIAGLDAPLIRAGLMGSLSFLASIFGRLKTAGRLLVISAATMILWQPTWVFDLGFQLSLAATAGLIWISPLIENFWPRLVQLPLIGQHLITTLAAQLAVWPLLATYFGQLSWISLLVNPLVLWTVAPITQLGMILGLISLIFDKLGNILIWIIWPLLKYFILLVNLFSFPKGILHLGSLSFWIIAGYYLLLILTIIRTHAPKA